MLKLLSRLKRKARRMLRCTGLVSWHLTRFESWSMRDDLLMDQWWAAQERNDKYEMERVRKLMNQSWQEYRNAS